MFAWGSTRTKRERALATRGTLLFHLRPFHVSPRAVRWTHTFGLGGSAVTLWLTLAVTGILTLFVYVPAADLAYDSVHMLEGGVRFGRLVRGVHYWSANLLVVVMLLHAARVFFTGGYHRPRRLNWVIGTGLIITVLSSAFTGYLLPWDQRAYWAVTISTGMLGYVPIIGGGLEVVARGGIEIGSQTLLSFYTYHTTLLPVLAITLMMFHFWRVRKAKGVVEPPPDASEADAEKVPFLPGLLVREVSQALVVLAVVVVLGALFGAPIGERANPGMSPNPAKAPWYFMGFQELLIHLHPVFAVLILPVAGFAAFVLLPWIGVDEGPVGRWFISAVATRTAVIAACVAFVATVGAVLIDSATTLVSTTPSNWFVRGILPTAIFVAIAAALAAGLRRRLDLRRNEIVQTVVVFFVVAFVVFTVVGVFFRGPGMALTVPWAN